MEGFMELYCAVYSHRFEEYQVFIEAMSDEEAVNKAREICGEDFSLYKIGRKIINE